MKHLIAFLLILGSIAALGQENNLSLTGGYSTTTGDAAGSKPTGYKISLNYDFQSTGEKWSVGGAAGYLKLDGTAGVGGSYSITTIPIYVSAKFLAGSEKFQVFGRVSLGSHFSSASYTGGIVFINESSTIGMSAGGGAGANLWLTDKVFLTADYEFLWLSNNISDTGWITSASGGIGMRF